jgi:hypothetical protein
MSDASGQGPQEQPPQSRYEVVPSAAKTDGVDLYSFRAEIPPPPPPPPLTPTQIALEKNRTLLMAIAGGGVVVLIGILVAWVVLRQNEPPAYIDLGTKNIAAAGLEARLVARWLGSAAYELHIDPTAPQQAAGFSAVAANPPHPLSVTLQFKDSSSVVCQKQILIPFKAGAVADPEDPGDLQPQKTFDGDTVQNIVSAEGLVSEIVVQGSMNCPAKGYKHLESWSFSSNFPLLADQQTWMQHEASITAGERRRAAELRARALIPKGALLAAPIEGDDTIVSDNPSHGSVETGSGRVFYIGKNALLGAPGWQVFPVNIHFRCDAKAACILSRPGTAHSLQARLVR